MLIEPSLVVLDGASALAVQRSDGAGVSADPAWAAWRALYDAAGRPSPGASPDWWLAALGTVESRTDGWRAYCVHEAGELRAVVAGAVTVRRITGVRVRILEVRSFSYYGDILVHPADRVNDVLDWLAAQTTEWDVLHCKSHHGGSALCNLRRRAFSVTTRERVVLPAVPVAEHLSRATRKHRSNLRRGRKFLANLGEVEVARHHVTSETDPVLDAFFEVENSGWKGRAGTSILALPDSERFFRRLARFDSGAGLRIDLLRVGGKVISGLLMLDDGVTLCVLKVAYREEYGHASPVQILAWATLEELDGQRALDFVTPAFYMRSWRPDWLPVYDTYYRGPRYRGAALVGWLGVRERLTHARDRVSAIASLARSAAST